MKIIMLGPPGSGKGTQAVLISKQYSIPHISTGDIFRENIKGQTNLGIKANEFIRKGNLVPDDVTIGLVKDRLSQDDCTDFILDGFPRTIEQAKAIEDAGVKIVLNIEVSDEEVIKRLSGRRTCKKCGENFHLMYKVPTQEGICDKCGSELYQREDDMEETVKHRLVVYQKQTQPLIDYYEKKGIVKNVNGEQEIDKIFEDIKEILN